MHHVLRNETSFERCGDFAFVFGAICFSKMGIGAYRGLDVHEIELRVWPHRARGVGQSYAPCGLYVEAGLSGFVTPRNIYST